MACMTFVDAVRICLIKYADFRGCAGRREFWWWMLFSLIGTVALGVISDSASLAFTIATLLPSTAVTTRRLHDTDRGGWMQLLAIIPIVGWILLIIWCAEDTRPNRFAQPSPSP